MNRGLTIILAVLAAIPWTAQWLRAQNPPVSSFAEPRGAESRDPEPRDAESLDPGQAASREDELYNEATKALGDEDYDQAIRKFDDVATMRGRKADAALYWKGYALAKAGNKSQATATFAELKKAYPQSKWIKDANEIEAEWKGATGNLGGLSSEEEKTAAFTAIMNSDPERGLTFAKTWLQGNASQKMKDKVLFVLATQGGEKAQDVLLTVAKANNDPDLQRRAIRYIGMTGNSRSRATLKEIYQSSSDTSIKKSIFHGWLMCGCKEEVLAVAKTEQSPELRREAIRYLGMMGGRAELRTMYKSGPDPETREAILNGLMMSGDAQGLIDVAATEKDPDVLDKAINMLGMVGGQESLTALTNIYNSHNDLATKKRVMNAMFLHGAAKEMVALARKEASPELKKEWIRKLSLMKSPEITEYMMEILNK